MQIFKVKLLFWLCTINNIYGLFMWVFGYGSLMWRPDFDFVDSRRALIYGLHRSLCIRSVLYRGTPEDPGLVLGLDYGGACVGRAFKIARSDIDRVRQILREREMVHNTYVETHRDVYLGGETAGEKVSALCYVVNRNHPQYAGRLALKEQAAIVRRCSGNTGPNVDYVRNTCEHLREMGIKDRKLEALLARL